jgi:hypothetical protein
MFNIYIEVMIDSISAAAEDGISPKPVQLSTGQARINERTSWYIYIDSTFVFYFMILNSVSQ